MERRAELTDHFSKYRAIFRMLKNAAYPYHG